MDDIARVVISDGESGGGGIAECFACRVELVGNGGGDLGQQISRRRSSIRSSLTGSAAVSNCGGGEGNNNTKTLLSRLNEEDEGGADTPNAFMDEDVTPANVSSSLTTIPFLQQQQSSSTTTTTTTTSVIVSSLSSTSSSAFVPAAVCMECNHVFCLECDIFMHDALHNCVGCC